MIGWTLERRLIDELIPYEKNPRCLSERQALQLSDSIDRFGLVDKPVINTDGTVIGGHQRLEIYSAKGAKEIDCWVPDKELDDKDVEELNIRLNRNNGDWDFDILANDFELPDLLTWGFEEEELGLEKPEKQKKKVKPTVSFEFTDKETMLEFLPICEEISQKSECKMKVRG